MVGTSPSTGMWQGEVHVFAISDCLIVIICAAPFTFAECSASESSSMALTIAPAGHDTTTMEEQWTCVADIFQICPLIGVGVPFPAPITGLWDFGYFGERLLPDKGARLACWNKACWVGGIESSDFRLCVNITLIASFSNSASQFLLYISTVQPSRSRICSESSVRLLGSWIIATKVLVTLW